MGPARNPRGVGREHVRQAHEGDERPQVRRRVSQTYAASEALRGELKPGEGVDRHRVAPDAGHVAERDLGTALRQQPAHAGAETREVCAGDGAADGEGDRVRPWCRHLEMRPLKRPKLIVRAPASTLAHVTEMRLYDLRVTVERIEGRSVCGLEVGDWFEVTESSRVRIPEGRHFCLFALQAVLPLLPAKMRRLPDEDWLERDSLVCCPDPEERLIMRIERIGERTLVTEELT